MPLAGRSAFAAGDWQEIWRRIAADSWFQAEVELCAAQAVRRGGAPSEDAADVASGAKLIIADELRVSPDLRVDVDRAEANFTGWMGTIIRHACSKALARLRPSPPASPLLGIETAGDESAARDLRIDVLAAIDKLREPERSIMLLRLDGRSLIEAAFVLGIPHKRADYAYQRGLRQLERALRDYRPPPKK
ncbi:MAG TPA: sigma-70 family RNA polymerase sigma factor [Pirellulales bacterium]